MRTRRSVVVTAVAATVAAGATVAGAVLMDSGVDAKRAEVDVVHLTADEAVPASFDALVKASALVVRGTVTSVANGRTVDDSDAGPDTQYADVTIRVTDAAKGASPGDEIVLEQMAETGGHTVADINGVNRAKAQNEGVWFLIPTDDRKTYVLTGTQGQYLVDGRGKLSGVDASRVEGNADLTREILALDATAVLARARAAE